MLLFYLWLSCFVPFSRLLKWGVLKSQNGRIFWFKKNGKTVEFYVIDSTWHGVS